MFIKGENYELAWTSKNSFKSTLENCFQRMQNRRLNDLPWQPAQTPSPFILVSWFAPSASSLFGSWTPPPRPHHPSYLKRFWVQMRLRGGGEWHAVESQGLVFSACGLRALSFVSSPPSLKSSPAALASLKVLGEISILFKI